MQVRPHSLAARVVSFRWPLLAIVAIWLAALAHLHERQQLAVAILATQTAQEADALADSIDHIFRDIDQALLYVRALHARDGDALDLEPWVNSAEIAHGQLWRIAIADRDGTLTLSDLRRVTGRMTVSDCPQFRHFAESGSFGRDDSLFIAPPVSADGHWLIAFARPLMTAGGIFDGIAMVSVDPATLINPYRSLALGRQGAVSLTGLDGIVRAGVGGKAAVGQRSESPALLHAATEAGGTFIARDPASGARRITGFRRMDRFPLVVEVSLPADAVPAWFGDDRAAVVAIAFGLSVVAIAGGMRSNAPVAPPALCVQAVAAPPQMLLPPPAAPADEKRTAPLAAPGQHAALDHLMDALGSSAVAGIVAGFLQVLPEQLQRLRSLAVAGEIDALLREARALTSSAATIGLDELAAAVGELEEDARRRLVPAIAARLDRIDLLARPGANLLAEYLNDRAA